MVDYVAKPILGNVQILFGGFLGLLLESMENVNTFFKLCQIDNPVFSVDMNPDLPHTCADTWHGLPVVRIFPLLDEVELKSGSLFNLRWKSGKRLKAITDPE